MRVILLVALLMGLSGPAGAGGDTSDKLERFVTKLPRGSLGIPFYWLEMKSIVGWEKMMLVFGYANNRSVCKGLRSMAADDAPNREFRCKSAN
jgi:hypothetical protein